MRRTGMTSTLAFLLYTVFVSGPLGLRADAEEPSPEEQRATQKRFELMDVFKLAWAADPQICPNGETIVYTRNSMDVMTDRVHSSLWSIKFDGSDHRPVTRGNDSQSRARWFSDGNRLVYISNENGSPQLYLRFMDTGQTTRLTQLIRSPGTISISPDGRWIALVQAVPHETESWVQLPQPPTGATWATQPKVIEKLTYRSDGAGYLDNEYDQVFMMSSDGGALRQVTFGPYHHNGQIAWSPDSKQIIFSANRQADWEHDPVESELYEVTVATGAMRKLTERNGPDQQPTISPDGRTVAYVGYDDRELGYHNAQLYLLNLETRQSELLTKDFDRSVRSPLFAADGRGIFFLYDDQGDTKIGYITRNGRRQTVTNQVGGVTLGRPYASGSFSLGKDNRLAFTRTNAEHPADVAVVRLGEETHQLTQLNENVLGYKQLGKVTELRLPSSFDQRSIQAWMVTPPNFDKRQKYPLILEIHGGPFANYGNRFSAEMQLFAAAGYVVLYVNPRGSTSYGAEFANLIHHNYPGQDYDDLMSAVDYVLNQGFIDKDNLFVTGGSGGGVLTAWIIGQTQRFRAAVVAKPVINWYSFALTADAYNFFYKYWFPGPPWEHAEHYLRRSPITYVGNVATPTMLITGEVDYRTPISETEQFYQALKLRKVETALVRIPETSHSIAGRPSRLMAKVAYILGWFERYRSDKDKTVAEDLKTD